MTTGTYGVSLGVGSNTPQFASYSFTASEVNVGAGLLIQVASSSVPVGSFIIGVENTNEWYTYWYPGSFNYGIPNSGVYKLRSSGASSGATAVIQVTRAT